MKKILILLFVVTGLLQVGCRVHPPKTSTRIVRDDSDTTRKGVKGVRTFLVLRPIDNIAKGDGKNYPFFYDYSNKTLDFTDNEEAYIAARNSLPEYITADSIGHGVELQSMSARPFVNFTNEATKEIALKSGIDFEKINAYRIAYGSNIKLHSKSAEAMKLLLNKLLLKEPPLPRLSDIRKDVDGGEGVLTMHPIENFIKDNNGKIWYIFYDFNGQCIYITDDVAIYKKFSKAIPMKIRDGDPENVILVQGISIDPFVYFNKETLEAMSKDKGLQINGDKSVNNNLNRWDVRKLSAYGIVFNVNEVKRVLSEKLNISIGSDPASTQTKSTDKATVIAPFPTTTSRASSLRQDTTRDNGRKPVKPRTHN